MTNNKLLIENGSKEERSYCKQNGIELWKLDNGVAIVGMSCLKDFTNWGSINYEFSEGAYGNPAGSVHFLEHFFNKKIRKLAEQNFLKINARTNKIEISESISGIANPETVDYGLWTILDDIRKTLESPLDNITNINNDIETERNVIKAEIQQRNTDHNFQVTNHFLNRIYHPKNPIFNIPDTVGTEDELGKITIDVLQTIQSKVLIPKNLLISVYTEGNRSILIKLIEILKQQYSNYPRFDKPKNKISSKLLEKLNPELKAGNEYKYDTKINNGIITIQLNWIFKHRFGSKKYFVLRLLKNILNSELFDYSRREGWGYNANVNIARPTDNVAILILRIDTKNNKRIDLNQGIINILTSMKTLTSDLVKLEQKRQFANTLNVFDRLDWVIGGLKRYGKIINADAIRNGMLEVDSHDLNCLIDDILFTPPVTIVTGDLR